MVDANREESGENGSGKSRAVKGEEEQRRICKEAARLQERIKELSKLQRERTAKHTADLKSHVKGRTVHKHRHIHQLSLRAERYARQVAIIIVKAHLNKEHKSVEKKNTTSSSSTHTGASPASTSADAMPREGARSNATAPMPVSTPAPEPAP